MTAGGYFAEFDSVELASDLVHPPGGLLIAAGAFVAGSGATLVLGTPFANAVGYVLGVVLTIGFIVAYRATNERRRRDPRYSPKPSWARAAGIILTVGFVTAVLNLWAYAGDVAK